jgi:hypothetical protein
LNSGTKIRCVTITPRGSEGAILQQGGRPLQARAEASKSCFVRGVTTAAVQSWQSGRRATLACLLPYLGVATISGESQGLSLQGAIVGVFDQVISAVIPLFGLLTLVTFGVCTFLAIRRRIVAGNRQSIRRALLAAAITAACIFLTTYGSAWVAYRPFVALGRDGPIHMSIYACLFRAALDTYAKEHGSYPDTLDEAFTQDGGKNSYLDPWNHPYQYTKTDAGYRLFSLGRDGKPGGVGLDADFDLLNFDSPYLPDVPVTFSQFLLEGGGSNTLFRVALTASLCAALACFIVAGTPRGESAIPWRGVLFSVFVTTVAAFFVVGFLMALYLVGSGH